MQNVYATYKYYIFVLQDMYNILLQGSDSHMKLLGNLRNENTQISTDMSDKIRVQNENLPEWKDKTATQLRSVQQNVEKFLLEDIRRDTPTGKSSVCVWY